MNTNCLNIKKAIVMSAMLIGGTTLLAQAPTGTQKDTSSTFANKLTAKEKFNRFSIGFRLSHLYDIQYNGFGKLTGTETTDPSGLNGSSTKFDLGGGLNFNYFITNKISLDLAYDIGTMTGETNDGNEFYESNVSFLTFGLNFDLKGNKRVKPYKFVPFLRASASSSTYDTKRMFVSDRGVNGLSNGTTLQFGLGAGMRYHFNDRWHLNFQSEVVQTYTDAWDGWDYGSGRDYMAKTSVGICFSLGNGLHIDRFSNNQMIDYEAETTPNNPKTSNMLALSDSLKNINQKIAKMLADNELLTKDSDGDGIPDYRDLCPEVKGAFVNGCNEMDGLKAGALYENNAGNKLDSNKLLGEKITNINSTDSNYIKNNYGTNSSIQNLSNNLKLELRSMLLVEMNKIYFETNKANLNATDRVILTQCAKVIMDNPSFKLTILGFADNVGSDEANYILSKNRAEAVSSYLENSGVSKNNIIIKPMGAQKMIGSDAKESNAYNRRVEFILE
jgi:outer membrane protein OmpA-like peptidoglycan-associated protein